MDNHFHLLIFIPEEITALYNPNTGLVACVIIQAMAGGDRRACNLIHEKVNPHFSWEEFQNMSDGNFHLEYRKKLESGEHVHPENFPEKYNQKLQNLLCDPSLKNCLDYLHEKYVMYVVSSTKDSFIEEFLVKEKVNNLFSGILGYDTHHLKVPKIKSILEKEQVLPEQCIFITDTIGDIKEAQVCGISSIGVLWGLHKEEKLRKEKVFKLVDTDIALVEAIDEYFAIL
jgi:phosphoglycolate phosphatase-like HAD superfamily hydrolase